MKRGIRYLRFSSTGQSNCSIESQDLQTAPWFIRNQVELVDTFIDEGHSARTFDRPDMKKLNDFIKRYHRDVDYLVVNDFSRFSRDAGEALVAVKQLQQKYGVQIVSVGAGITYDYNDNDSFFRTGLDFLLAEEDNRRRINHIKGGIYASKKEGRYLGPAPIGYLNSKDGRKPILVVDAERAPSIQYIFRAFLSDVPNYIIKAEAKKLGLKLQGNSAIPRILTNPVYTGLIKVKAFKSHPEEMVEGLHEPIIDRVDWMNVQDKLNPKRKPVQIIHDEFPLRGVLLCHCGKPLTGAPSRGKSGRYFNYYKCQHSRHNNINANKAHDQLQQIFSYLNWPDYIYTAVHEKSKQLMEEKLHSDKLTLKRKSSELAQTEEKLHSVEEKWILEQMNYETYQRWHKNLSNDRFRLKADIEQLSRNQDDIWNLLDKELYRLKYMDKMYEAASTVEKQQLVRLVFDSRLYYQDRTYRTPYIMQEFAHNTLILKEKKLLFVEEKKDLQGKSRLVDLSGTQSNPFHQIIKILSLQKVA
jgi:site-specific DNA recombinase